MKAIILVLLGLLALPAAFACDVSMNATTTTQLIDEIPSLNEQLESCPVDLPGGVKYLIKDGAVTVDFGDSKATFYVINKKIIAATTSAVTADYTVLMSTCTGDAILSSEDMVGTFVSTVNSGQTVIHASSFWKRTKMRLARFGMRFYDAPRAPAC